MARNKNDEDMQEEIQDVSVFPEGHQINSWDNVDSRSLGISASRSREFDKRPSPRQVNNHRGRLWFPTEEIPDHLTYASMTERLLNEPQNDNLQEQYENGWEFVNQSDHPSYAVKMITSHSDNRLRRVNTVIMKKPKVDYIASQKALVEESLQKQREATWTTNYFGDSPGVPRHMVENSGSYTPSYTHKRG